MEEHVSAFRTFFAERLNEAQQRAVAPRDGVFIVRAGAGSGKTRVITARIMHLIIEHNVLPTSIVALTFTNKAAREMHDRVAAAISADHPQPTLSTFHSYCLHLLKVYGGRIMRVPFSILDMQDRDALLKAIIKRHGNARGVTPSAAGSLISRHKNEITRRTTAHLPPLAHEHRVYQEIFAAYEQEKQASNCLDFDDLLLEALRLFQTTPYKEQFQSSVRHLLIDEYQDTNKVQHALMREMVFKTDGSVACESLCIVGDEDQSIYSWRGATVDNLLSCTAQFPAAQSIAITQNYRSVQPVLDVANAIIQHNRSRHPKELWSLRTAEHRVIVIACATAYHEAELIAQHLRSSALRKNLSETVILYRSHFQSRALEEAFIKNSIPYRIVGGTNFYDRQEVKDVLAYLKVAVNPHDRVSFMRTINTPHRGLGDAFVVQWNAQWDEQPTASIFDIGQVVLTKGQLRPTQRHALEQYLAIIATIAQQETAEAALTAAIESTQFVAYLQQQYEAPEAHERCANVTELEGAVVALAHRSITTIEDFLHEVALIHDHIDDKNNERDVVRLMTIHSAKGLEFDTVILPGLEEGVFPSSQASHDDRTIEEERRLLYVGITRARERVFVFRALSRFMFGTTHDQAPSRFLAEMPSRHVIREDYTSWHPRNGIRADERYLSSTTPKPSAQSHARHNVQAQGTLRLRQKVSHRIFGEGTIVALDRHTGTPTHVTVAFADGIKKIAPSFLTPLS